MLLKFNNNNNSAEYTYTEDPILHISKVSFTTSDINWADRLSNTFLLFKLTCFNSNDEQIKSYQETLSLSSLINPYQKQPHLNADTYFFDKSKQSYETYSRCVVSLNLLNLTFKEGEYLSVTFEDKNYYKKCIADWQGRIDALYIKIANWLKKTDSYSTKRGSPIEMYEPLMDIFNISSVEVNTADIYKKNKLIASLKPKGLWVIGSNGLIDLLTHKGSFYIVDAAEPFNEPNWLIYANQNAKTPKKFTEEELLKVIA